MEVKTVSSKQTDMTLAVGEVERQLSGFSPNVLIVGFVCEFDGETLANRLERRFNCIILGGTSCKGTLCINSFQSNSKATLSIFALHDPNGQYGTGHCTVDSDISQCAKNALDMALYASGRGYESPAAIWCMLPPGKEEQILQGFKQIVGERVPILGGSSADNDVVGKWQQISELSASDNQIVALALYPSTQIGLSFSSGYQPSGQRIIASKTAGRLLLEANNQPAAQLYNDLTNSSIQGQLQGGNVLSLTTLHPLGRLIKTASNVEEFILSHPDSVTNEGALTLFSEVNEGDELHIMEGSRHGLIQRADRVLSNALDLLPNHRMAAGVLMIYCAGCMLTIEDELDEMTNQLKQSHPSLPIMSFYTFGEQGCFLDGVSRHGNLMISALAFSQ